MNLDGQVVWTVKLLCTVTRLEATVEMHVKSKAEMIGECVAGSENVWTHVPATACHDQCCNFCVPAVIRDMHSDP